MTRKDYELSTILKRREEALRSSIKEEIISEYCKTLEEIERRNVGIKKYSEGETSVVRIDYFKRSIFMYMFSKLHRGDRLAANKLANELLIMVTKI